MFGTFGGKKSFGEEVSRSWRDLQLLSPNRVRQDELASTDDRQFGLILSLISSCHQIIMDIRKQLTA